MSSETKISVDEDGQVQLTGSLTFSTVPALFDAWAGSDAVSDKIDLQKVNAVDSAGLAFLLEWSAKLRAQGKQLAVVNAPEGLKDLADLCDAGEWLTISVRNPQ